MFPDNDDDDACAPDFESLACELQAKESPCGAGHVHAYERTHRVFDYELRECAPMYITVGDGGNVGALRLRV